MGTGSDETMRRGRVSVRFNAAALSGFSIGYWSPSLGYTIQDTLMFVAKCLLPL